MNQRACAFCFATMLVFLPYAVVMSSSGCSDSKMPDVLGDPPIPETGTKPDTGPDVIAINPDAGPCDNLPLGGYVTQKAMSGMAPTPAGGTIVDGLYVLTAAQLYGQGSDLVVAQSLLVKTGTVHFTTLEKGMMIQNAYGTYAMDPDAGPNQILISFTSCDDGGIVMEGGVPSTFGFTATGSQFDLSGVKSMGTIVDQFTRQ